MAEDRAHPVLAVPTFAEHLTMYVDFIGTSEAASGWNESQLSGLAELLTAIAKMKGAFTMTVEDTGGAGCPGSGLKSRPSRITS